MDNDRIREVRGAAGLLDPRKLLLFLGIAYGPRVFIGS